MDKIGVKLDRDLIAKYCRSRSKHGKLNPILVVCKDYNLKKEVLFKFKSVEDLKSCDIGIAGDNKIHVGNHLTTMLEKLLNVVKLKLIGNGKYKYAWVQHDQLLIGKMATSKIIKIKSEN